LRAGLGLFGLGCAFGAPAQTEAVLVDPTRPPGYVEPAIAAQVAAEQSEVRTWSVSMIRVGARQRLAIVNGELVREGDQIGGVRVLKIEPRTVQLERRGKRYEVAMTVAGVKEPADSAVGVKRPRVNE